MRRLGPRIVLWTLSCAAAWPSGAIGNERHFTFTYESAVLPMGAREIEIWATGRIGRTDYYSALDQRLELEFGLTERLMAALYLNGSTVAARANDSIVLSTTFGSVSAEAKYKLLDPVADVLGFALYGEATTHTNGVDLEAKLIFDKRIGELLLAANLVVEHEWQFGLSETERELALEVDLAASYFITHNLSVGLELRNQNVIPGGAGLRYSALFAGPTVAYAEKGWWVAFSLLPQLPALKRSQPGSTLILDDRERYNARLLFSFHL